MTAFLDGAYFVINYIIDMGASVMLPIIIAILSVCIGIKPGKAIRSGLMIGVGFVGMGLIVDMMNAQMGPAAQAMAERLGVSLSIVEVGWPGMSGGRGAGRPMSMNSIPHQTSYLRFRRPDSGRGWGQLSAIRSSRSSSSNSGP